MSNEPVRKVASFDESAAPPVPGARPAPQPVDLAAEAETALAAIRRIEAALAADHAAPPFARLRHQLDETASDIAEARLAMALDDEYGARTVDVGALLDRLEGRIAAMLATAGAGPAARPAEPAAHEAEAEPQRVPTVSAVVSRLERPEASMEEPEPAKAPSFAMLEAMVEALTAPAKVPEPAELVALAPADAQTAPEMPPPAETATHVEAHAEAADDEPASIPVPTPEPAESRIAPVPPESDLLSSFARMESIPFLPPEIGTAVIFRPAGPASAPEPAAAPVEDTPAVVATAVAADDPGDAAFLFEPADADAETDPAAFLFESSAAPANTPAEAPAPAPQLAAAMPALPPPPPDPLAPLRARSAAETVALFS